MTAFGSTQTAVAALKLGAHDYLVKPFDVDELKVVVRNALEKQQLQEENLLLKAEFRSQHGLDRMVGVSPAMVALFNMVRSIAPTSSTVLITGETGTGKEVIAHAIHANSRFRSGPFVAINCAAVPAGLLESELFGHARGAFTDAKTATKGLLVQANGGTLLLDEISELPLEMQPKLLRALQERTVRPVGERQEVPFDCRIIAATTWSTPKTTPLKLIS